MGKKNPSEITGICKLFIRVKKLYRDKISLAKKFEHMQTVGVVKILKASVPLEINGKVVGITFEFSQFCKSKQTRS